MDNKNMETYYDELYEYLNKFISSKFAEDELEDCVSVSTLNDLLSNYVSSDKMYSAGISKKIEKKLFKAGFCPQMVEKISYNHDKRELMVELTYCLSGSEKYVYRKTPKGDIVFVSGEPEKHAMDFLNIAGSELEDLFLVKEKFCKHNYSENVKIKSSNSILMVSLLKEGSKIETNGLTVGSFYNQNTCILTHNVLSNSLAITRLIRGNEELLSNNICVKISDCPKNIQDDLREHKEELKNIREKAEKKKNIFKMFKR